MDSWFSLFMLASALGMDAFSMALAFGASLTMWSARLRASLLVGSFHMAMPLLGMAGGSWMAAAFSDAAGWIGALLLFVLGVMMIKNAGESDEPVRPLAGAAVFMFAFIVSLDSFSIGISLGAVDTPLLPVLISFGLASGCLTAVGFGFAHLAKHRLGVWSERVGGAVLIFFALHMTGQFW
ncbi:putative Mn2+ efflux pump MntP [Salsuginibacillus halophilus]|uniref:Putative Mn2+ efflux pump MntP n=1 Tax=Salsuginibacillus halophilus TaxID=517424 RepID=A0A2P8HHV5_9BACI|nr:manganese efflux pump [Salsuginibacillus halophilus]PSL45793.1 putative Mn2+ efflux pump MntP [Salsuginibacillus halophilus]